MSILQHQTRRFYPQLLHGLRGRLPRFHAENAAELPGAQVCDVSEAFDGKILAQMALCEGQRAPDAVRLRFELEKRRMLRLATRTTVVNDELTRDGLGNVLAEILLDHGQRKIDHRGHSGGGPDQAVLDEDAVFLDADAGVALPERDSILPMGRDPLALEQAGSGQDESAFRAGGCHASRLAPPATKIVSKRADRSCWRSGLRHGGDANLQRIDPDRIGDVLELGLAKIGDREIEPALHLTIGVLGKADRARIANALQPRGDVDAVAHKVAVGRDSVPGKPIERKHLVSVRRALRNLPDLKLHFYRAGKSCTRGWRYVVRCG